TQSLVFSGDILTVKERLAKEVRRSHSCFLLVCDPVKSTKEARRTGQPFFCARGGCLMRKHFTCSQGHRWDVSLDGQFFVAVQCMVCPACGAAAETIGVAE